MRSYYKSRNKICKYCEQSFIDDYRDKCIDHCHVSGRVRGLICQRCNRALGYFGDTLEGISKVKLYLSRSFLLDDSNFYLEDL